MSEEKHEELNPSKEELNPANEVAKAPLDMVKEQQSLQQHSRDVVNNRPESDAELPGHGVPSDRRKHPQRIHYDKGRHM